MLELRDLRKIYQTKTRRVAALDGVSFALPEKGFVFILGRSGSGKTTMLNMLGGLDAPTEGELIVDEVSSRAFKQADFDNYRNRYVGFVFQEYHLLDDYTVADNIALALELQGDLTPEERQQKIAAALEQVDLAGYGDRNTGELSGGQKQRVAIARALVKNPPMILADEPTGALDRKTGRQLFDLLKAISKDKLVVVVSHDEDFAHEYADRILELEEGKIISDSLPVEREVEKHVKAVKLPRLGLSLKSVLNRGKITLRRKKWKISVISLLCVVSFVLTGFSDMLTSYDWKTTLISSLADESPNYVAVSKEYFNRYNMDEISIMLPTEDAVDHYQTSKLKMYDAKPGWYDGYQLREADIEILRQRTNATVKGVFIPHFASMSIQNNYPFVEYRDFSNLEAGRTVSELSGFVEFCEEDLSAFGYSMVAGRLPDGTKNEIAISKYVYDSFAMIGYSAYIGPTVSFRNTHLTWNEFLEKGFELQKNNPGTAFGTIQTPGMACEINTPEDLIGKTLFFANGNYTITGIIDTNFDSAKYADLTKYAMEDQSEHTSPGIQLLKQEILHEQEHGMTFLAFIGTGKIAQLQSENVSAITLEGMDFTVTDSEYSFSLNTLVNRATIPQGSGNPGDVSNEKDYAIYTSPSYCLFMVNTAGRFPATNDGDVEITWKDQHVTFSLKNATCKGWAWNLGWDTYYETLQLIGDAIIVNEYVFNLLTEGRAGTYSYALISAPDDRAGIAKLVDDCYAEDGDVRYPMQGIVASQLNNLNNTLYSIAALFSRIDAVLVVFTMLLFTGYIFISIAQQKQAIGIMRALGAGIRDVFSIYFMEGILIAVIGCVASILLLVILTPIANLLLQNYLSIKLSILTFGFRQMLAIVLLSFGIAFVASIIPILRIARQKPVDAIRKN